MENSLLMLGIDPNLIENDEDWKKNNLEYEMKSNDWLVQKVKDNWVYAQNLYAAMCNREFQKLEPWPMLKEETWSCSWRYAGGIIAEMRGEGDYMDWYCSGIYARSGTVSESEVTDEIRQDLIKLGWRVLDEFE